MLDLDGLRDHRGDDREEFRRALVVALRLVAQVHAERAHHLAAEHYGDADVAQLLAPCRQGAAAEAVEEHGLAADLRDDDGLAGLHDAARDAFADAVADAARGLLADAVSGRDQKLVRVALDERHGPRTTRDGALS